MCSSAGRARGGFGLSCPSFALEQGETVLLLGESGSGKSTLLSLICGIVTANAGKVEVGGTEIGALPAGKRDRFRAEKIGVIFQQFNLLPYASVADNIALPLRFAPERRKRAGDIHRGIAALCQDLGLPDGVPKMTAGQLSVGQQQRVAVARALIGQPDLIIAGRTDLCFGRSDPSQFFVPAVSAGGSDGFVVVNGQP